jgi:hypothetical protein
MLASIFKFFTSLKLTVVCLCMSLVVVFFGTMAQDPLGLYIAQERFFHSFFIDWASLKAAIEKTLQMVDVYVAAPTTGADVLAAPRIPVFPGGYLLGSILLINLIVTHYSRFKFSWPKAGIFLTHIGIVLLLVGQLFTDVFSSESSMRLSVGESRNYAEDFRKNELVLIDGSSAEHDVTTSIPQSRLRKGAVIEHASLPFKLRVLEYWGNADFTGESKPGYTKVDADKGFGPKIFVKGLPPVTAMDGRDMPGIVLEAFTDSGSLGRWFSAVGFSPRQVIEAGGKEYQVALRIKRYYTPYSLTLVEARHDKYKGTEIPRNFSSVVRVKNSESGEDREVKIFMNNPLRYQGKTYYQYQMAADEMMLRQGEKPTSTFQVVENPSWLAPYLACVIVGLGLLYQFGLHLKKFFVRKAKA